MQTINYLFCLKIWFKNRHFSDSDGDKMGSISSRFWTAVNIILPTNGCITGPRLLSLTKHPWKLYFVFSQLYFVLGRQATSWLVESTSGCTSDPAVVCVRGERRAHKPAGQSSLGTRPIWVDLILGYRLLVHVMASFSTIDDMKCA